LANTIDENLRAYLAADSTVRKLVGGRIHENHVPQPYVGDYIWFAFAGGESERTLSGDSAALFRVRFDLECIARSISQARRIAAAVFAALEGYARGATFGDTTLQGIFVEEQPDEYLPRGVLADSGLHVASKSVEVVP
jgi:hypothetical protein